MKEILIWIGIIGLEVITLIVIIAVARILLIGIYENNIKVDNICNTMDISCDSSNASNP